MANLESWYKKGRLWLSDIVEHRADFRSDLIMMSSGTGTQALDPEDAWCIDQRGILTLSVCKETYECLGLVGTKLPFKHAQERYVICILLQGNAESAHVWYRSSLKAWDERRAREGLGSWEVLYWRTNPDTTDSFNTGNDDVHRVGCCVQHLSDVHVPIPTISHWPIESEDVQDWTSDVASLFEWVGMACLGSQRLKINDSVDPYIAVYEPPPPSRVGNVTHLRWRGLLAPSFIQTVLDTAMSACNSSRQTEQTELTGPPPTFISITSHSYSASPVSYIPLSGFLPPAGGPGQSQPHTQTKVPRGNAEHTWSLILVPEELTECDHKKEGDSENTTGRWIKAESIGQWDTQLR